LVVESTHVMIPYTAEVTVRMTNNYLDL